MCENIKQSLFCQGEVLFLIYFFPLGCNLLHWHLSSYAASLLDHIFFSLDVWCFYLFHHFFFFRDGLLRRHKFIWQAHQLLLQHWWYWAKKTSLSALPVTRSKHLMDDKSGLFDSLKILLWCGCGVVWCGCVVASRMETRPVGEWTEGTPCPLCWNRRWETPTGNGSVMGMEEHWNCISCV